MVERKRHLAKAVSWRVFGSAFSFLAAVAVSRSIKVGIGVSAADFVSKIFLFYVHERVWYRIKWGVKRGVD